LYINTHNSTGTHGTAHHDAAEHTISTGITEGHHVDEAERKFDDWANQFDRFDDDEYNPKGRHIDEAGRQGD
jgi:hypothetical protein